MRGTGPAGAEKRLADAGTVQQDSEAQRCRSDKRDQSAHEQVLAGPCSKTEADQAVVSTTARNLPLYQVLGELRESVDCYTNCATCPRLPQCAC